MNELDKYLDENIWNYIIAWPRYGFLGFNDCSTDNRDCNERGFLENEAL